MNLFKRMASIVLMAIMLLQTVAFAAPVPEDVIGTEYESAASMLCALDIMVGDGKKFKPDDDITRAEFAQILMKSLALDSAVEGYAPVGMFTDVPKKNIFAPAIELGAGIGAIKGYGDGKFGPNDKVKGTEAVKMMVYAVGYEVQAEATGGYPAGYMAIAREIGMLKGITSIDFSVPMTRGQAAILCANTLKVDYNKKITSGEQISYIKVDGVNLLSDKHDTYTAEGIVSANDVTGLYSSSSLREGRVQLDGAKGGLFDAGETTIANSIGQYVRAFYKYDTEKEEGIILSYDVLDNRNIIQKTSLENIVYNTVTNTFVEYWADPDNDNRTTEVDISSGLVSIIYNGSVRTVNTTVATTLAEVQNKKGDITFIDNNSDNKADVLIVNAFDTIVVNRINATDYIFTDKIGTYSPDTNNPGSYKVSKKDVTIDVDSSSITIEIVNTDGDPLEFDDISVGDVISVATSDPSTRQYIKVIVSDESVDGAITQMAKKNGLWKLAIDDEWYEITPSFFDYISEGKGFGATNLKIELNKETTFYLDSFERIAFCDEIGVSEDVNFGFLKEYAPGKGANSTMQFKIYFDEEFMIYPAADKIMVDGVQCRESSDVKTQLDASLAQMESANLHKGDTSYTGYYDGVTGISPILFELDEEDKIISIDTPYLNTAGGESEYSLQPVKGGTLQFNPRSTYLSGSATINGTLWKADASIPVITIPGNAEDLNKLESYDTISPGALPSIDTVNKTNTTPYAMLFATAPNSYRVDYILAKSEASTESGTPPNSSNYYNMQMFIVSESIEMLDEEGNKTIMISGIEAGEEVSYVVNADYYSNGYMYRDIWQRIDWSWKELHKKDGITKVYTELTTADLKPEYIALSKAPERTKENPLLPGDAIRVYKDDNDVVYWAESIFLPDAKIARLPERGEGVDSGSRYSAFDLALINDYSDEDAKMTYLAYKTNAFYTGGGIEGVSKTESDITRTAGMSDTAQYVMLTKINTNASGFVTDAYVPQAKEENGYAKNRTFYADGAYVNSAMTLDASYDPTAFTSITVFDAKKPDGYQVYSGSEADLRDATSSSKPASLVLMQFRGSTAPSPVRPWGMYIIKY